MNANIDVVKGTDVATSLSDLAAIREITEKYGFCLVKSAFTADDMQRLHDDMRDTYRDFDNKIVPDILSCKRLNWILFDDRITQPARTLLGQQLVYYPETAVNYEAEVGALTMNPYRELHADAVGTPKGLVPFWQPDPANPKHIYQSYRFAIYSKDYKSHSGGLKVVPGSHLENHETYSIRVDQQNWQEIAPGIQIPRVVRNFPLFNVPSEVGDLVIWNLHTRHAAGVARLKSAPDLALLPEVENYFISKHPDFLCPIPGQRNALFFDLGAPAQETDLYIKSRAAKRNRDVLKLKLNKPDSPGARTIHEYWAPDQDDARELAKRHGVMLRNDVVMISLGLALINSFSRYGTSASLLNSPERPLAERLVSSALTHVEFSPHFALFDAAELQKRRGDMGQALEVILNGLAVFGLNAGLLRQAK